MRSLMPLWTGLKKMCQEEEEGLSQSGIRKEKERRREKELKRIYWHKNKPGQVFAPLTLDPIVEVMSKEMKSFKDLEKVTG